MHRYVVWLLIAFLWLVTAVTVTIRQGWRQAWLQAVVALLFFALAAYFRRKDRVRQ